MINRATFRNDVDEEVRTILKTIADPRSRTPSDKWIIALGPNDSSDLPITYNGLPVLTYQLIFKKAFPTFDNTSSISVEIRIISYSDKASELVSLSQSVDNVMKSENFPQFNFTDYSEDGGSSADIGEDVKFNVMSYFVEVSLW